MHYFQSKTFELFYPYHFKYLYAKGIYLEFNAAGQKPNGWKEWVEKIHEITSSWRNWHHNTIFTNDLF